MLEFLAGCPYENDASVMGIISIAKTVVRILQIAIPIALIIWGTIDLGKAVIAGKEDDIKKAQGPFVKRIVAAVIVFIVPWLVNFAMGLVSNNEWYECWTDAGSTIRGNNSIGEQIKKYNFR